MAIVVQKYGGSSVATPHKLGRVADRVVASRLAGDLPVVVVSAMGRTTDALVALKREISQQPHRREMDMVLSSGERISMALLAMAIVDRGCEAVSFTGSQAGIITTTDHNQARIIEVRPIRVHEALEQGHVVIVGGFAGVSTDKNVTTLGRGGSDTTAIALAAALDAAHCDIFSDVDGVYSADPRVVHDARRIDQLAHGEILEMGLRGARVLAPEAIDYARRHGVTLRARSSFGQGSGTVITTRPRPGVGRATAVTADPGALIAQVHGPADGLAAVLQGLEDRGVCWREAVLSDDGRLDLVLDTRNSPDAEAQLHDAAGPLTVDSQPTLGTVTVVGEGLAEQASAWRIAREQLAALQIAPRRMAGNAWGITAQVPRNRLDDVVRSWHAAYPGLAEPDG